MTVAIISAKFLQSSPRVDQCPQSDRPEYAFIGRSNVGKSSLINTVCDDKKLARTSSTPGRTQLINYFSIESMDENHGIQSRYLVDLPGYGYAKVSKNIRADLQHMIEGYFKQRNVAHVFVLIDGRHTPQAIDMSFLKWLHTTGKTYTVVFTKSDKVSQKELSANIKLCMKELEKTIKEIPPHFSTSAEKRPSTYGILEKIHTMNMELTKDA